jgi:cation diffusion facilitator CzcD-associated flavoprotein CzcO
VLLNADADVVVVGAGMSGLYALKVLRDQGLPVFLPYEGFVLS